MAQMLGKIIIPLLIAAFIATIFYLGCWHDDKVINDRSLDESTLVNATEFAGMYRMVVNKDTAVLNLHKWGAGYRGDLTYHRYYTKKTTKKIAIDSTRGSVYVEPVKMYLKGYYSVNNDSIHAREIIFKVYGKNLVEGYGSTTLRNDSIVYKRPANLEYDVANPFKRLSQ